MHCGQRRTARQQHVTLHGPALPPPLQAGVLSEAALALEAEVQANPGNADAWRLLGTVHAENDDDIRVGAPGTPLRDRLLHCCIAASPPCLAGLWPL